MSVNSNLFVIIFASAIFYGTPLVFAAVGELLAERSGVINLGVEGMMLLGAVCSAMVAANLDGPAAVVLPLALLAAMVAAGLGAAIHAFLVITSTRSSPDWPSPSSPELPDSRPISPMSGASGRIRRSTSSGGWISSD